MEIDISVIKRKISRARGHLNKREDLESNVSDQILLKEKNKQTKKQTKKNFFSIDFTEKKFLISDI